MTAAPKKEQAVEGLLINRITARPESVFAITRSLVALSPDEPMATEVLRQIVAPDLGNAWKENIEAAALLGTVEVSTDAVRTKTPPLELHSFKRLVRRRMREWEDEGNPNSNCSAAMRVALGMPLRDLGLIPFSSFVASVNVSLGSLGASDVRVFNESKAGCWLRWMMFADMAVGKGNRFAPHAMARFREVIGDLEPGGEYSIREFLMTSEEEVPCTTRPASECPAGPLPPTTVAALTLLEVEGTIQLMPIGDAEEWVFPDERRSVTHLRLTLKDGQQ